MRIKTSELQGNYLDWFVALIEYPEWKEQGYLECFPDDLFFDDGEVYSPSLKWSQGGPIIEREKIDILFQGDLTWLAVGLSMIETEGQNPLIAAMRCYVASKLGNEVEIPEEMEADHA